MRTAGRTGILGGTFDPVHLGHTGVAEAARAALSLDRVLFIPARTPPHRPTQPHASAYHRFAMVSLAIAPYPALAASDLELLRDGPSYTMLTLDALGRSRYASSQLFFITGADAFAEIATWMDYPAILDRCHFVAVSRPGHPAPALRQTLPALADRMHDIQPCETSGRLSQALTEVPAKPSVLLIDAPTPRVSSTDIRRRVRDGQPIADQVHPEVKRHILRHALYFSHENGGESLA